MKLPIVLVSAHKNSDSRSKTDRKNRASPQVGELLRIEVFESRRSVGEQKKLFGKMKDIMSDSSFS